MLAFLEDEAAAAARVPPDPSHDTWVAPLVQVGTLDVRQDEHVTTALLHAVRTLVGPTAPVAILTRARSGRCRGGHQRELGLLQHDARVREAHVGQPHRLSHPHRGAPGTSA
jgi:hypothetical protein